MKNVFSDPDRINFLSTYGEERGEGNLDHDRGHWLQHTTILIASLTEFL